MSKENKRSKLELRLRDAEARFKILCTKSQMLLEAIEDCGPVDDKVIGAGQEVSVLLGAAMRDGHWDNK